MKKLAVSLAFALAAALFAQAGSQDDARLTFYTSGPDCYADGKTRVPDGEFYALVWVVNGKSFSGFKADGSLVDAVSNKVIWEGAKASGGCLGGGDRFSLQVPANTVAGGSLMIVLLDTRMADGTLSTPVVLADGSKVPAVVNGYGPVYEVSSEGAVLAEALKIKSPITISAVSAVPDGVDAPVIAGAEMRKDESGRDIFVIQVKCTSKYLQYTAAAATVETSDPVDASAANGADDPEKVIEIKVPATDNTGLYKVIRK